MLRDEAAAILAANIADSLDGMFDDENMVAFSAIESPSDSGFEISVSLMVLENRERVFNFVLDVL